jgi:hypothetical protein
VARLRVFRESAAWTDRMRAYRLVVDGHERGMVKEGETLEIDLWPGEHQVWMKIDWVRSRKLKVNGGEEVELRCRGNSNPLLALLYVTIWRHDYIALDRV